MAVSVTVGVAPAVANPNFVGASSTFTNMNGGTNIPAGSTVVVGICFNSGTLTSATMGGTTLTSVVTLTNANNAQGIAWILYADLVSSTTDTLVVNYTSGSAKFVTACSVYLTGAATGGATASASDGANHSTPYSVTLACPANGAIIAFDNIFATATVTCAWTNMSSGTSDITSVSSANLQCDEAHSISASNPSVTGGGGFASTLLAAAWSQFSTRQGYATTIVIKVGG